MMKNNVTYRNTFGLLVMLILFGTQVGQAQKKERLRLSASYTKIMDGEVYLDFQSTARIERKTVSLPDIALEVFYEVDGEEFPLGTVTTDTGGKARYVFGSLDEIQSDSTGLYILGGKFNGNDAFRKASRRIEFRDGAVEASVKEIDSVAHISASFSDIQLDSAVADALIKVQVQRMFKPLIISEEFLMTDETGSIQVSVPDDIPGKDGILTLEVVIEDNDNYGNIKKLIEAPIGTPIVVDNTYHERTLWATRDKTPLFILFFTIGLIVGSWGAIIYLIVNLFKISKSK